MAGLLMGRSSGAVRGFLGFLTTPQAISAGAAVVATPIVSRYIVPLVGRIPVVARHRAAVLIISAIIMFVIAKFFGGFIQAIFLGVAAGLTIGAFNASGLGARVLGRIHRVTGGQ